MLRYSSPECIVFVFRPLSVGMFNDNHLMVTVVTISRHIRRYR
ncbi:type VI secretion system Vgr family domain protein [Burkholderia cepacia]|nr:type VI secretion system Vgr family domain protein [Burkholderia cepacia]